MPDEIRREEKEGFTRDYYLDSERDRELQQARETFTRTESARVELKLELLEATRVVAEAREEIARLKEALTNYGVHKWNCKKQDSPRPHKVNCTCGFSEALHPVPEKPKDNA